MGNNVKKRFTVSLDIDTKDIKKQFEGIGSNLQTLLADIGKASDKMGYFKELVDYISQIDKAMTALREKNKDAFDHMFDGLDENLRNQLQGLFGTDGLQLKQLDVLRDKLATLTPKSGIKELRLFATEINDLFASMGLDKPLNIEEFMNTRATQEHINKLKTALADFATVWGDVNSKIRGGFGAGGNAGVGGGFSGPSKQVQEEIDKLKKQSSQYQSLIDKFNQVAAMKVKYDKFDGVELDFEATEQVVDSLIQKYNMLGDTLNEYSDDSIEYADALAERAKLAMQMIELDNQLTMESPEKKRLQQFISDESLEEYPLEDFEYEFEEQMSKMSEKVQDIHKRIGDLGKVSLNPVADGFKTITTEAEQAADATKKVMYHLGNLLNGKGSPRDTFGDMIENLTTTPEGTRYEQYGFGVFGGGLFGVSDPSTINQDVGKSTFIQSVDLSKYNMYMADTEERATALIDFLSKLQKFSIKSAEPNYTGFDSYLNGANIDSLYDQFKVVFEQSDLTKDQFNAFVSEMVTMLKQAGLAFDEKTGQLDFSSISKEVAGSENISTRFMKMLGYEGVNVGTTSFDGLGQGSVLFDFEKVDIVGYFNSAKEAVQDYQKIIGQTDGSKWVGSTEQLQQYASNIDAIIGRLEEYKKSGTLKDTSALDETLRKLTQIKTNIGDILSGKDISGNSPFETITTGSGTHVDTVPDQVATVQLEKIEVAAEETADALEHVAQTQQQLDAAQDATDNQTADVNAQTQATEKLADATEEAADAQKKLNAAQDAAPETAGDVRERTDALEEQRQEVDAHTRLASVDSQIADLVSQQKGLGAEADSVMRAYYDEASKKFGHGVAGLPLPNADHLQEAYESLQNGKKIPRSITSATDLESSDYLAQALFQMARFPEKYGAQALSRDQFNQYYSDGRLSSSSIIPLGNGKNIIFGAGKEGHYEMANSVVPKVIDDNGNVVNNWAGGYKSFSDIVRDPLQMLGISASELRSLPVIQQAHDDYTSQLTSDKLVGTFIQLLGNKIPEYVDVASPYAAQYSGLEQEGLSNQQKLASLYEQKKAIEQEIREAQQRAAVDTPAPTSAPAEQASAAIHDLDNAIDSVESRPQVEVLGDVDTSNVVDATADVKDLEQAIDDVESKPTVDTQQPQKIDTPDVVSGAELFDTDSGQLAFLDGISDSAEKAEADIQDVVDAARQLEEIPGQLDLFGEDNAVEAVVDAKKEELSVERQITDEMQQQAAIDQPVEEPTKVEAQDTPAPSDVPDITPTLEETSSAFKEVEQSATGAANAQQKFSESSETVQDVTQDPAPKEDAGKKDTGSAPKKKRSISDAEKFAASLEKQKKTLGEYSDGLKDVGYVSDELRGKLDVLASSLDQVKNQDDLDGWVKDFKAVQKEITTASKVDINKKTRGADALKGALRSEMGTLDFKLTDTNLSAEQGQLKQYYQEAIDQIEAYKISVRNGQQVEIDGIQQTVDALNKKIKAYKDAHDIVDGRGGNKQSASDGGLDSAGSSITEQKMRGIKDYISAYSKEAKKLNDIGVNIRAIGPDNISADFSGKIEQYNKAMLELRKSMNLLQSDPGNAEYAQQFDDAALKAKNARVEVEGIIKQHNKLQQASKGNAIVGDKDVSQLKDTKAAMIEFANTALDGKFKLEGFNKAGTEMYGTLDRGAGAVENVTIAIDGATGKLNAFSTGTTKVTNEWEDFKNQLASGAKNIIGMYFGLQEAMQAVRTGVGYVKEIDLAMTELKKVTDETDESYKQFLQDAGKTSAVIGSTISDFTNATAMFARLGYSLEESSSMAETAIIYKNVADGLDTVEEASDSIISTMMAFGIEADNTMSIVDRFNAVGNNFAITSAGIGDALQRSASALFSAGNTIDESIALVTAANSVIQNPEQVGTALKTLALRLRGAKTELEEAGLETDNMAESTSTLQAKLNALTHGKVDIMLDADTFKSTTQILREMSEAWEDMTDIERASALELMGGKRQANILSSVIQNFETVEDVIETSMNSSGSAMAENEKWLDSIEGKTYQFTNALQTMWSNMINSEVIKSFIDFGTDAIQFLDTGAGKVVALVAALKLMAKFKGFSIGGIVKGLGDTINKITTAQQTLQKLSSVSPVTGPLPTESINAYAKAVAGLTAKQQANLLASQNLTKHDIQRVLQTNQCTEAAQREALAHIATTNSKEQELAASYRAQAAILGEIGTTEAATAASTAAAAADWLEANSSEGVTLAKVQEAVQHGIITAETGAEIIAKLGLAGANKTLLGTIKALYASNPVGWILGIVSAIISLIPLISSLVGDIQTTEEKLNDLNQEWDDLENKIDTISNDFKDLKSSMDGVIPRFTELAKGVDQFGDNVSLTSEEYAEFLDLNNKIADMFPEINNGMDSNGNAMLSLSYTSDILTASLERLVEAERQAANQEIADTMPDVLSNISESVDAYKDQIKEIEKERENLKKVYDTYFDNIGEDEYVTTDSTVANAFADLGFDVDKSIKTKRHVHAAKYTIDFDIDEETVKLNYENAMGGLNKQIENINTQIANKWEDLNPIITAYLETNFQYGNLSDEMQEVARAMVGNIDFAGLGLDTPEKVEKHIRDNILNPIQGFGPEAQKAFSNLLSIDTDDKSTREYIDAIRAQVQKVADLSGLDYTYVMQSTGYDDIVDRYKNTAEQITDILQDSIPNHYYAQYNEDVEELVKNIYSLSPEDMLKSLDIIKKYGIKTWDELEEALKNKTFDIALDYNVEQTGIQQLTTAMEESVSATGLSADSIANLKARYQDLEGYNPAKLFEETTNGIHLNTQAARELERAYAEQNKSDIDKKLEGLVDRYNELTSEIEDCSDASERANLYRQKQNVIDQINDTATLAAQYEGLTSAYNNWKNAQSGGDERDMYEGVLSGIKEVEEEMSRGWVDEGTRAFLEMLSGKDLSTAKYDELLQVYRDLNKEIAAGYNVYDFFTTDKDGNATTDGIFNFFDAVKEKQEEVGEEWVKIGEDGQYIFDFGEGGDKAVAEALNISEELVQIILRAAQDAGFEVNLDSTYSELADLQDEFEAANNKLKELGKTEYTFDINSTSINDVNDQIAEAEKILDQFRNEDGTINLELDGAEEAQTLLATLIYQKQTLDDSAVLSINVEAIENGDVKTTIDKLLEYKAAYNDLEIKTSIGADTTEAQARLDEAKKSLEAIPEEHRTTLNIDLSKTPEEINTDISNITKDQFITFGVNDEAVTDYVASDHTAEGTVVWSNNIKEVTDWINSPHTADGTVKWNQNLDNVDTFFRAKGVIDFKVEGFANGTAHSNGTAHITGSAFAGGHWGAEKTETALVGELGPEILVRNGRWTTVGENGAEFTQVKKGDIIFNHKQTEELLKNGYVTGRGKSYAGGTAYSIGGGPRRKEVTQAYADFGSGRSSSGSGGSGGNGGGGGGGGIADDAAEAADEFREVFDWIAVRLEEINDDISLKNAQLENEVGYKNQNKVVDELIDLNQKLYDNLLAGADRYYTYAEQLLAKVPEEYRDAAQNGTIAIEEFVGEVDEETLEAIQEYREWVQKGDDATQQAEETLTEISNLAAAAIKNIQQEYDNKTSLTDSKMDQLDAYNEYSEAKYGSESAEIYQEKIKLNDEKILDLNNKRNDMQAELDKKVQSGEIEKYSQAWYDAVNDIAAVDTEIINLKTDTENYQDAINEIHWGHFDNEISRIQAVSEEADNLIDILSEKDMVTDDGEWTEEGITTLGLYAQKMEAAEAEALKYQEAISYLNDNWQEMGYTEQEYLDKLGDLKDGQYDAVKSYEDSKKAIVDLNKERIDSIKNGIEEEIDAYKDLTDAKKEELDAEKDLHDFQKSVMDQQKDIADIERQLAALSGDNSAAARAKRAQLEAELAEAKAGLEETYYERSVENQKEALDKEAENFQETKEKEMEDLDEYLENADKVVGDSVETVQNSSDVIGDTLAETEDTYGLDVSNAITDPWKDGANAISEYTEQLGDTQSSTIDKLDEMSDEYKELENRIETFGEQSVDTVEDNFQKYQQAEYQEPEEEKEDKPKDDKSDNKKPEIKVGGNINAGNAKIYDHIGAKAENQYYAKNPTYKVLAIDGNWIQVRHSSLKSGITGWFKKSDVKAYAKGSKGVNKDQLALIDELGDELLIRAHNGRLTYMEKGSGVVPADLTSNLMKWGKLDPSSMIEQNRPQISVSPDVNNTQIQVDNSIAELIHIDNCSTETLPDVEKMINSALEKHTQRLNQSLRKYTR